MTSTGTPPNLHTATKYIAAALDALGMPWRDLEDMHATPERVARMWAEMTTPAPFDFTTFPNEGCDEMIVERDIRVVSLCRHHLLPFTGVAHIGYIPDQYLAGLSKLARAVDYFARRPQVQEELTNQIADMLVEELKPQGVGVVIHAEHTCMTCRGARKPGTVTITSALRGVIKTQVQCRQEFLQLVG